MTEHNIDLKDSYSKKELVINTWLLSEGLSKSDIADIANCSYEYARRIVSRIESEEIDPQNFADENLQSVLEEKLQTKQLSLDFNSESESSNVEHGSSEERIQVPTESTINIGDVEFLIGDEAENVDGEGVESKAQEPHYKNRLEDCLNEATTLRREAQFYLENNEDWALWQYYVSTRAVQLLKGLLDEYEDESIPKYEIYHLLRTFEEFYHEAEFEAEYNLKGAEQKKYTAYRIYEILNSIIEEGEK